MPFKRNQAVTGLPFALINATSGAAVTTGTATGYVTKDGGAQATITAVPVHEGNGQWTCDLTAGEMDGLNVGLLFTHASAIPVHFTIRTETKLVSDLNDAPAITTPANFSSLSINGSGHVIAGTVIDKTGYALAVAPATAAALADLADQVDTWFADTTPILDKLDSTFVLDGSVYQFTANALELGPTPALDKTGYKLASDGLDLIAVPTITGPASTFPGYVYQLWRRFFKKAVNDRTGNTLKTYADDGTTVVTTQTTSTIANVETVGPAS